ncbi:MAG: DUF6279 family lipoprotein [Rubrivivax sp.]|jgi:hypothetical protein|nr:DUF6279 family lipoprotein [Rubrivivax sp.]
MELVIIRGGLRRILPRLALAVALFALTGCTALRLGYNNGPLLAWWWIDGYADFNREQAPQVRGAIDRWFDWHRSTQLPEYLPLLQAWQQASPRDLTPEQACRWAADMRVKIAPSSEQALQLGAEILPRMGSANWLALERKYVKNNDEMREEFLQTDKSARMEASIERAVKRFETLYGRLDEPQRRAIREQVLESPFDPEGWLQERARRQRDTLATLKRLSAEPRAEARVAGLRLLAGRSERADDPAYRAYQQKLEAYNCNFMAKVHNSTTPRQRAKARDTLKGWEDDLRALIASQPPAAAGNPATSP